MFHAPNSVCMYNQLGPLRLTAFVGLVLILFSAQTVQGQANPCSCTNCPQFMQDNFTGSFLINIQNASNPTLGQNGQGVCGVVLNFDHEYLGDLSITLTSPSGQSVVLVGPIGFFGATDGTSWNVTFVPCADPASPDPGFTNTWNNNQTWGLFGNYTGSYYPSNGCLENFNTGPVNGTWTLTVVDGQANDEGNFYGYEIIFCDPSSIDCFSCAANAGNLLQNDVVACEGSSNLNLNLPPTYPPNQPAPPAGEYTYTYVIAGAGGVIEAYDPGPDLSAYPPGTYTVCGMSYLTFQEGLIPVPNGSLTVAQLTQQLNSTQPPFCGRITTNCVNVTINPLPADVEEIVAICAPGCYTFYNQLYCQSGTYVRNLLQNGCPFTATLILTVTPVPITNLSETICSGDCSQTPGFGGYCSTGLQIETFQTADGCDSIVRLNLTVITPIASITPPPPLGCGQSSMVLQGTGSSVGGGTTYLWTASNGGNILGPTNGFTASINAAGDYQLRVCRPAGGSICCDSTSVTVTIQVNPPAVPGAITGPAVVCQNQTATFSIAAVPGAATYIWTVPAGVLINSGQNTTSINVGWNTLTGGDVCVSSVNNCGTSTPICISVMVEPAVVVNTPLGDTVVCGGVSATYSIAPVPNATNYNWTVSLPASIVSGQGTPNVLVQWGNVVDTAQLCVGVTTSCGTTPSPCLNVIINTIPPAPVPQGSLNGCAGGVSNYTVTPVFGADSYNWQVTGGVISSGQGTNSIQVTWNANVMSGIVCVTSVNECGESQAGCINIVVGIAPAEPLISGDFALCAGDTGTYAITPVSGSIGYLWTVPVGATILSGQNTTSLNVLWSSAPGGNICVSALSSCGAGPQNCQNVVVNAIPVAFAGTDADTCGFTSVLQAVPSFAGTTGSWTLLNGTGTSTIANPNNPVSGVTVTAGGAYLFQWTEVNMGCNDADTVTLVFNEIPLAGQLSTLCNTTNDSFIVNFTISGGTSPFVVTGGTVTNNVFVSDPIPNATGYAFTITDADGCSSLPITGSINCNCTSDAGTMSSLLLQACEDQTVTAMHNGDATIDGNDVFAYVLHSGNGPLLGTVYAQNNTGVFGLQAGMLSETMYYISYVVGNDLNGQPDLTDICFTVSVGQPVIFHAYPVADAGVDDDICGLTMPLAANPGNGLWSVASGPAGETLVFVDPLNPQTSVSASGYGVFTLVWTLDNNGCTHSDTLLLTFNDTPVAGLPVYNCNNINTSYTVSLSISGGVQPYSVDNLPITGNTFVSGNIPSGSAYSFSVSDANGCIAAPVTGSFLCNCTTDAGEVSNQLLNACPADSVTASITTNPVLDGNDVSAFVLHTGNGTALGTVIAQNTTGVFGFLPGMVYGQTYYISQVAGDALNGLPDPADPCFSVSVGQPVVFRALPAPNAGPDLSACGNLQTVTPVPTLGFTGNWQQIGGPGTAVVTLTPAQSYEVSVDVLGTYTLQWTETNGFCPASDTVVLTFNEIPSVAAVDETCNGTNTGYNLTVTFQGGTVPYTVSGLTGTVSGNVFTSNVQPNFSNYSFTVASANGCFSAPYDGSHGCDCTTDAGTMQASPLLFCADQTATATWNNNAVLDVDDLVLFVLHDQQGPFLGNVIEISNQPVFTFGGSMQTGVTYYISAIAGNNVGGSISLSDPCLSVSSGTPVQWKAMPLASITGDATLCLGQSTPLSITGSGAIPLTVVYSVNGVNDTLTMSGSFTLNVSPAQNTNYALLAVFDGTQPVCGSMLNSSVNVAVSMPVDAGSALAPDTLCAGTPGVITLINLLSGADAGGVWTEVSGQPSTGGAFNVATGIFDPQAQAPGTYRFSYLLDAVAPCPDDATEVSVVVLSIPVADAGVDKTLDCLVEEVTLGGSGTTIGSGIVQQWFLGSTVAGTGTSFQTNMEGQYTLVVNDLFGCSDSDDVVVLKNTELPFVTATTTDVRCFGDKNGTLSIDSMSSSFEPLNYFLNGISFGSTTVYNGLLPGSYVLEVEDTRGCVTVLDTLWVGQPDELTIELGADITVSLGDLVTVDVQVSVPETALDTIYWNPLVDTLGAGQLFQQWLPLESGYLSVRIIDTSGCAVSDRILVVVDANRNVYFPNAIKPDSDFNDYFTVFGGQDVVEIESMQIHGRWGEKVFERFNFQPNDPYIGWNGAFKGDDVQPGVYVWVAVVKFLDGEKIIYTGDVTVIR